MRTNCLPGGFFGFGGLFLHPLRVLVIDGRPEGGGQWGAREWEWFRGGQRRDWRGSRVRVSRTGCVPGREVCLGKQLSPLQFYLCEGRRVGPGYAHPQVSYQHSPRLRLLVSDVGFDRKRAVRWRDDPPGACIHALRPCVRVHSTRCGSLGAPRHSAWMHDGALPLREFLQA
jgi:hypothetical protein